MRNSPVGLCAFAGIVAVLGGCQDSAGPAAPAVETLHASVNPASTTGSTLQERLDVLAAAVAAAAADPAVRQQLIRMMAASAAPEGKVYLRDAASSVGALGAGLATRFGGLAAVTRAMDALPALDFYIASETHRRSWRAAGSNVAVIGVADPDQGIGTAFFADGRSEVVTDPNAVAADALLAIHPTERGGPAGASLRNQITDRSAGRPRIPAASPTLVCEEGGDECGGGGGGWYAITRLFEFEVAFRDWIGLAEVEFRADGYCGTSYQASGTYRQENVNIYTYYQPNASLIGGWAPSLCPGNGKVVVGLYETDPFITNFYGSVTWNIGEGGAAKTFFHPDPTAWASVNWLYVN